MATPGTPRPLRRDAERNRRRILDAARALVAERGLDVSHDDIARAADLGVGTVYRRFPDKQELFDELLAERVEDLVTAAERARGRADPWEGLREFVTATLEHQAGDPGLRGLMGHGQGRGLALRARRRMAAAVVELVERAHASGQLRPEIGVGDVAVAEIMVTEIVDRAGPVDPELWRRALAVVLEGFRARGGPPLPGAAPPMSTVERLAPRPGA
ncbi:TetR/AcrR family transcriptional regulator [Pseudonocardia lacus]|uniref:TetR/AcrR family transcriptional regulator n=1 Tax=Pseudonocardia lacus TaxID=2835865 RepID=UPI001BDD4C68|nr:TetR/AcrR family transcriptional regulator [Pseudonocardia lacus]